MPDARGLPERNINGTATTTDTRSISTRQPITRTDTGRSVTFDNPVFTPPSQTEINELNTRISSYLGGKTLADYGYGSAYSNVGGKNSSANEVIQPFGFADPFRNLGDAFLRAFGGSTYNPPRESERTIVESGGGNNNAIILAVLAAVGFGIYYFFIRNK